MTMSGISESKKSAVIFVQPIDSPMQVHILGAFEGWTRLNRQARWVDVVADKASVTQGDSDNNCSQRQSDNKDNAHRYSAESLARNPSLLLHRRTLIRQPFDRIPPADDVHKRHTGHLANAPSEFAIARRNDVDRTRAHALDEAVVGVRA
jgi:hypothetical protein